LLVAPVWEGFRVAWQPHPTLRYFDPLEQALTIRTLPGAWALLLAVTWFAAVHRRRAVHWWEVLLVGAGLGIALVRLGNVWLAALLLAAPLASQATHASLRVKALVLLVVTSVLLSLGIAVAGRPAPLPPAAAEALRATGASGGSVFADRAWASDLQHALPQWTVLGAGDAWSQDPSYWEDYFNVSLGWHRWDALLDARRADTLVVEPARDQADLAWEVRRSTHWHVLLDAPNLLVAERVGS
jgi:hypothetical protein